MSRVMGTLGRGLLAATLALAAGTANAADFYAGLGVGQATSKDYEDYVANTWDDGSFTSANFDDSDTGYRVFVGARITPNFSAELGHVDFDEGSTRAESDGTVFYAAGPVRHSVSADGLDLSVVGRLPVSEAAGLHVRLGMLNWDASEKISDSTGGFSGSDDGSDFFFAFGGEYSVNERVGIRAEYAFYSLDTDGGTFDVDMLSVAGAFYFGAQ